MKIEKLSPKQKARKRKQWKSSVPGGNSVTRHKKTATWYPNRRVVTPETVETGAILST